jgi:hypothetical protein
MKQRNRTILLAGTCLLGCGVVLAQAPPGPMTPPPSSVSAADPVPAAPKKPELAPRKSIFGAWRFNKDESDDGRRKLQNAKGAENTNRGNGPYGSGPRIGGPWPGGGGGGYPGGGGRYPHDDSTDYDQMGDIVNPPREIKFSQQQPDDPSVELIDDREHRRMFYTDGRKLQKTKGPDYEEIAAKWDGSKLVTDEKGAHNGKLSRTYEVAADGRQLIETVHVSDSKGNHPVNVQYVYDAMNEREFSR